MKISKKAFVIAMAIVLVVGISGGVFAAGVAQQITATLDPGITVTYNGAAQNLTDANGNAVYPILYNGSTYLPVRAVSDVLGVKVDWENATRTVVLGEGGSTTGGTGTTDPAPTPEPTPEPESGAVNLAKVMSGGTQYNYKIAETAELTVNASNDSITADAGLIWITWSGSMSLTSQNNFYRHDVTGKDKLTFTVWSRDAATVVLIGEGRETIYTFDVEPDTLYEKEIDISQYDTITFAGNSKAMTNFTNVIKFLDPIAE